jgi:hypothetical protein
MLIRVRQALRHLVTYEERRNHGACHRRLTYQRVPVADDVSLNAAVSGSCSPIVLLHGFPQTHLTCDMSPLTLRPTTP